MSIEKDTISTKETAEYLGISEQGLRNKLSRDQEFINSVMIYKICNRLSFHKQDVIDYRNGQQRVTSLEMSRVVNQDRLSDRILKNRKPPKI